MKTIQNGLPPASRYNLTVFNTSAEQVPPFGLMQIVGSTNVGTDKTYNVAKPTGTTNAKILLNSPSPINPSSYGAATDQYPAEIAYSGGTPIINAEWGPINNSWSLSPSGKGFLILGGAANGVVNAASKSSTLAGDDFPLVRMVNESGLARPFGTITGYGNAFDAPPGTLHRIPTFGTLPPQPGMPFAVLLSEAAAGQTVDAAPVGVVAVQIDYKDSSHKYADIIASDYTKLASTTSGPAAVLWREKQGIVGGGTLGVQWARVRLDFEKFRLVRGECYTSSQANDARFEIKNIVPLAGGRDPRNNPADAAERLWVANVHGKSYVTDEKVVVAYSENAIASPKTDWEALPKTAESGGGVYYAVVTSEISSATGGVDSIIPGDGYAQFYSEGSPRTKVGFPKRVLNYTFDFYIIGSPIFTSSPDGGELVSAFCNTVPGA